MQNYRPLNNENKMIILLLFIFLFGMLILSDNSNSCKREKNVK